MAKIIIHRKNEIIYKLMSYHVFLNNRRMGTLKPNETVVLKVKDGNYKLRIKGGLLIRSNELKFSITSDEPKEFVAESFKKGFVKSFIRLSQL